MPAVDFPVQLPDGSAARLYDFPAPVVLIFLRHLACIACRSHLREVLPHHEEIKRLGADVLVVSFSKPERVRVFLEKYPLPFPVVSDADLTGYRAFGLGHTTWGTVLHPVTLAGYLKVMWRGVWPGKPAGGDDLLQLGGDFILDRHREVVFAHPCRDPLDRPAVDTLLTELRKLN